MAVADHPITRAEFQAEMQTLRDELREHYATKADLSALETRLIKWMVGQMIAAIVAASSIALLIQRFLG